MTGTGELNRVGQENGDFSRTEAQLRLIQDIHQSELSEFLDGRFEGSYELEAGQFTLERLEFCVVITIPSVPHDETPPEEEEPPLTEQFRNQGQCIREARENPDSGITRQACQEAFRGN